MASMSCERQLSLAKRKERHSCGSVIHHEMKSVNTLLTSIADIRNFSNMHMYKYSHLAFSFC